MEALTRAAIAEHAAAVFPCEACGVIIVHKGKERFIPCRNTADNPFLTFRIDPRDYAQAEDQGEVVAIVHSHPKKGPQPSDADLAMCEATGLPWHILSWPGDELYSFTPSGWRAPLIGRTFHHGVLDCYTLIKDYYAEVLQIELPHFEREDDWWQKGGNLYLENFARAGFRRVGDLQQHDVILMQMASKVPNHAAIYLDPARNWILHHMCNRLSAREVYTHGWRKATYCIVRHQKL